MRLISRLKRIPVLKLFAVGFDCLSTTFFSDLGGLVFNSGLEVFALFGGVDNLIGPLLASTSAF